MIFFLFLLFVQTKKKFTAIITRRSKWFQVYNVLFGQKYIKLINFSGLYFIFVRSQYLYHSQWLLAEKRNRKAAPAKIIIEMEFKINRIRCVRKLLFIWFCSVQFCISFPHAFVARGFSTKIKGKKMFVLGTLFAFLLRDKRK